MKIYQLWILLAALVILSCSKENTPAQPHNIAYYVIDSVRDLAPLDILELSDSIIFENEYGFTKEFAIDYLPGKVEVNIGLENHALIETVYVGLSSHIQHFTMSLNIRAGDSNIDGQGGTVKVSLYPSPPITYLANLTIQEGGFDWGESLGDITLHEKEFLNVCRNANSGDVRRPFGYIYYNYDQGIIGFTDFEGDLWTIKEYIN